MSIDKILLLLLTAASAAVAGEQESATVCEQVMASYQDQDELLLMLNQRTCTQGPLSADFWDCVHQLMEEGNTFGYASQQCVKGSH